MHRVHASSNMVCYEANPGNVAASDPKKLFSRNSAFSLHPTVITTMSAEEREDTVLPGTPYLFDLRQRDTCRLSLLASPTTQAGAGAGVIKVAHKATLAAGRGGASPLADAPSSSVISLRPLSPIELSVIQILNRKVKQRQLLLLDTKAVSLEVKRHLAMRFPPEQEPQIILETALNYAYVQELTDRLLKSPEKLTPEEQRIIITRLKEAIAEHKIDPYEPVEVYVWVIDQIVEQHIPASLHVKVLACVKRYIANIITRTDYSPEELPVLKNLSTHVLDGTLNSRTTDAAIEAWIDSQMEALTIPKAYRDRIAAKVHDYMTNYRRAREAILLRAYALDKRIPAPPNSH